MPYCDHCHNTGWLDCYCGGDLCICENNGEYPCPHCQGFCDDDDEVGCLFPDQCLMPGEHFTSECHTVEMVEDQERDDLTTPHPQG